MNEVFVEILNNSLAASYLIVVVVVLHFFLKRAPKWILCLLWALVAVRLALPFRFESEFSLIPNVDTMPVDITAVASPGIDMGIQSINSVVDPVIEHPYATNPAAGGTAFTVGISALAVVWMFGIVLMLLYALGSFLVLRKRVSVSVK